MIRDRFALIHSGSWLAVIFVILWAFIPLETAQAENNEGADRFRGRDQYGIHRGHNAGFSGLICLIPSNCTNPVEDMGTWNYYLGINHF